MIYVIERKVETIIIKHLLRSIKTRTLKCITGNTLRDRIRNENIRNIYKFQDGIRWVRRRYQKMSMKKPYK